ncbi:MAG: hypothetical protein JO319_05790 [Acidobacteriaceae bacterium]|nr:hypothetical protein [Acidobacteriaceae bacterium]
MPLKRIPIGASLRSLPARWSLPACRGYKLAAFAFLLGFVFSLSAKDRWTELNIGPFYVATDSDVAGARNTLAELEQLRWVLGGLLESKDLPSVWPIRVLFTRDAKTNPSKFVWQNGDYLFVAPPGSKVPLGDVARILVDANTPLLPPEVESGLMQLFSTLEAHGSKVTWGGAPQHPDLAWARMQLFATKFEYGASFHIFLTALNGGTDLRAAERNAFGRDPSALEAEAKANLQAGNWQPVPTSGRPLDPKRDFGEHSLSAAVAGVYLANAQMAADPAAAEAAYKAAVAEGGAAAALGYEGLAALATVRKENPQALLDDAIRAGSKSAPVYVSAAKNVPDAQKLPLLKTAERLNPLWAEPVYLQAQLTEDPAEKEGLLKKATQLNPRATECWIELAQVQTSRGESTAAQGSWLRAEDSAPEGAERDRIVAMRNGSEQERLDAAEAAQRNEREAAHRADQQAQQSEEERIRAAEQRANASLDASSKDQQLSDVHTWDSLSAKKKVTGILVRVDCLSNGQRLWIKEKAGTTTELFLRVARAELPCGAQTSPRRVSGAYQAHPDENLHTAGEITDLTVQ